MKNKPLYLLVVTFLAPLVSCEGSENSFSVYSSAYSENSHEEPIDLGWDGLTEKLDEKESFALIVYRPTCPYCHDTIPFAQDYMEREKEKKEADSKYQALSLYYFDTMNNKDHINELQNLLLPAMAPTDMAVEANLLYVPNLTAIKGGEVISSETGLPQSQALMDEKLDEIKELIS